MLRCWANRGVNKGYWCGKIKDFQFKQHKISNNCKQNAVRKWKCTNTKKDMGSGDSILPDHNLIRSLSFSAVYLWLQAMDSIIRDARLRKITIVEQKLAYHEWCREMKRINWADKARTNYSNKIKQEIVYFIAGMDMEASRVVIAETTQEIQNEYSDVFTWIECFKGALLYRSRMMQNHIRCHLGAWLNTKEPFKKELENYKNTKYWHNKTVEWYNSFFIVPKPNGIVYLCLAPHNWNTHKTS